MTVTKIRAFTMLMYVLLFALNIPGMIEGNPASCLAGGFISGLAFASAMEWLFKEGS